MNCVTGKISYVTKALAEEALVEKRSRFWFREDTGPVAVYQCDDCGEWHFTSKGPASDILRSEEVKRRIEAQQEANFWERKLRK